MSDQVRRNVTDVAYHIAQYSNIISELRDEIMRLRSKLTDQSNQRHSVANIQAVQCELPWMTLRFMLCFSFLGLPLIFISFLFYLFIYFFLFFFLGGGIQIIPLPCSTLSVFLLSEFYLSFYYGSCFCLPVFICYLLAVDPFCIFWNTC